MIWWWRCVLCDEIHYCADAFDFGQQYMDHWQDKHRPLSLVQASDVREYGASRDGFSIPARDETPSLSQPQEPAMHESNRVHPECAAPHSGGVIW